MFDKRTLVLEGVTLAELVELVVQVLVDLASGTVLDQETTEDTETSHPEDLTVHVVNQPFFFCHIDRVQNLRRHPSILGTLPLTISTVSADSAGLVEGSGASTRVHGHGLSDNETIADELADRLSGVGIGDFVDFVRVEPDLALTAADDRRGEALLSTEVDPIERPCYQYNCS